MGRAPAKGVHFQLKLALGPARCGSMEHIRISVGVTLIAATPAGEYPLQLKVHAFRGYSPPGAALTW